MAKAKTTTKKKVSKSTVGGSALKSKMSLNWKIIVPIIVLIALVGGFQVFRSRAAGGNTFDRNTDQMSGGTIKKVDGITYRSMKVSPSFRGDVDAFVSSSDVAIGNKVCALYKVFVASNTNFVNIQQQNSSGYGQPGHNAKLISSRITDEVCTKSIYRGPGTVGVYLSSEGGDAGVQAIYGKY